MRCISLIASPKSEMYLSRCKRCISLGASPERDIGGAHARPFEALIREAASSGPLFSAPVSAKSSKNACVSSIFGAKSVAGMAEMSNSTVAQQPFLPLATQRSNLTRTSIPQEYDFSQEIGAFPSEIRLMAQIPWVGSVLVRNARRDQVAVVRWASPIDRVLGFGVWLHSCCMIN